MVQKVIPPHQSSLKINANIAVMLIYIIMAASFWIPYLGWAAWVVPLVFFLIEKSSKFVKYQAAQALIIGVLCVAIDLILQIVIWSLAATLFFVGAWGIVLMFSAIKIILRLAFVALEIYLLVKTYGYSQVELPIIGSWADKLSAQLDQINVTPYPDQNSQPAQPVQPSQDQPYQAGSAQPVQAQPPAAQPAPSPSAFCSACGAPLTPDQAFCPKCGAKVG